VTRRGPHTNVTAVIHSTTWLLASPPAQQRAVWHVCSMQYQLGLKRGGVLPPPSRHGAVVAHDEPRTKQSQCTAEGPSYLVAACAARNLGATAMHCLSPQLRVAMQLLRAACKQGRCQHATVCASSLSAAVQLHPLSAPKSGQLGAHLVRSKLWGLSHCLAWLETCCTPAAAT
jgi:hypothetical protein